MAWKSSGSEIVSYKGDCFPQLMIFTFLLLPGLCRGYSPAWTTILTVHILSFPESPVTVVHPVTLISYAFGLLNLDDRLPTIRTLFLKVFFLTRTLHAKHLNLLWLHLKKKKKIVLMLKFSHFEQSKIFC